MTTRDGFEKWAIKEGYAVKDFIADQYPYLSTQAAWNAWQARQQEIDALKAEIEKIKNDGLMTNKNLFERWFAINGYDDHLLSESENGEYLNETTKNWWYVWQGMKTHLDEYKADIAELTSNIKGIKPAPPDQLEHKLDMVPADNQDALDAARYRFLKANLVGGFDLPGLYSLDVIDHESWDATIDESMKYATEPEE